MAWVVPGVSSTVTIWGTVGAAGPLVASATAKSLVEPEPTSTLADNTAMLTIAPPIVTASRRAPPLLRPGAAHVGPAAIVTASFSVDEPVTVEITLVDDKAKPLTLLANSQVGRLTTMKPQPRIAYSLAGARDVKLRLRVRDASLKRGHSYRIVVDASAVGGQSRRLAIRFKAAKKRTG